MPAYHPTAGGEGGGGSGYGVDWAALQARLRQYHRQWQANYDTATESYPDISYQQVRPGEAPTQDQFPSVVQSPGVIDWSTLQSKAADALAPNAAVTTNPNTGAIHVTQDFKQLMGKRADKFIEAQHSQYWQQNPYLWAQLVTSRYRENVIDKLASQIPDMDKWIRAQNTFAGVSGGLVALRRRALNIPDPMVRFQALQEVDALTSLDPETQQSFLAQASVLQHMGPERLSGRIKGNTTAAGSAERPETPDALNQGLGALLGGQYGGIDAEGQIKLHTNVGEEASLGDIQLAALNKLFPGSKEPRTLKVYATAPFSKDTAQAIEEWNTKVGGRVMEFVDTRQDADIVVTRGTAETAVIRGVETRLATSPVGTKPGGAPTVVHIPISSGAGGAVRPTGESPDPDVPMSAYQANLVAHELGHALGLEHPQVGPNMETHGVMGGGSVLPNKSEAAAVAEKWGFNEADYPGLFDSFGRVVSPMDVARSIYESQGFQTTYESTVHKIFGPDQTPLDQLEGIFNSAMVGPGAAIKGASIPLSAAWRNKFVNKASFGLTGGVADKVGAGLRLAERAQSGVVSFIGDGADAVYYKTTGNHMAQETKDFVGNVALVILLHEAGEVAGTVKTTLGGPAEYTQGTLGFEGGTYGDVVRGAIYDPRATVTHPISTLVDPLVQQSTYNLVQLIHSTALEDWVTRGPATRFFSYVEDQVKTLGRDDALAAIQERYPALSRNPGWAEEMVDAAANERSLAEATVDFSKGVGLKDVRSELEGNATKLREVQDKIDSGDKGIGLRRVDPEAVTDNWPKDRPITPQDITWVKTDELYSLARNEAETGQPGAVLAREHREGTIDQPQRLDAGGTYETSYIQEVQENGFPKPVELSVDPASGYVAVTDGNHALEAAHVLGDEWVPVVKVTAVPTEGVSLADKLSGRWRPEPTEEWPSNRFTTLDAPDVPLNELFDQLTDLQAERAELRAHQVELYTKAAPIYEFPTQRSLTNFFHKVLYRPATLTERLTRVILNPLRTVKQWSNAILRTDYFKPSDQAFIAKLVDKIGSDDRLKAPQAQMSPGARASANDMNVTYLNRLFQRFGVSSEDATASISKVLNAKSTQEFWEAVTHDVFGQEGVLSKYLPKNTPKSWADSFLNRYDVNSMNLRGHVIEKLPDGSTKYSPLIPGETKFGVPQSLPGAPSEFASYIPLPSAGELDRILSGYRRVSENLKNAQRLPRISGAVGAVMDFGRLSLHLSTSVLKPIALLANLPAIIMTKQLDEALGNAASPNVRGIMHAGQEADSLVGPIDPAITGNAIAGAFMDNPRGVPVVGEVALRDIVKNGIDSPQARLVWTTRAEALNTIHDDWWMKAFVEDGFDAAKFKARIETQPAFMRHYNENLKPMLDRAGMTIDDYLGRLDSYIHEVTFDHPDFLEYVRSGRMSPGGAVAERAWHGQVSDTLAQRWASLQEETGLVREALSKLDRETEGSAIRAHQERLKDVLEETDEIESRLTEFGGVAQDKVAAITRERPGALAQDIARRFDRGEINLPDIVKVDTKGRLQWGLNGSKNALEFADEIASKFAQWMYGRDGRWSFRRIGEFEGKYARGSFYEQRALQYAKGFRELGMKPEDALEFGRLRAGVQARDIFYDLTARSTTERALRNVFWFAPVNAELLYRWLYAIPSQAGGLIPGALITAARASAWLKLLDQVGITHTDPNTGQKVIGLSGAANFIEHASGGHIKMPDILELPLASLNPHLSSPIPQLSPLPALVLNKAGDSKFAEYAPVLKDLSNLVAPHAFTTFIPSSIRNVAALAGIKLPDFSPDYVNQQWDRTHDVALQYAYNDLQHQGVVAPDYEKYGGDQDAYLKDYNAWYDRLTSTADEYARGLYLVSTLSSLALPGYLVPTDPDKQAYEKFYEDKIKPQVELDNGATSDATRAKMNNWLSRHPESLAYSISYGYYTGKTWQPDLAKTDSDYYTSLYLHGVKATMDPEEYGPVLAALTSKSYHDARLQGQLNRIAPDGSPATMLRNWGERAHAVLQNRIAWQNYKYLHPEVDGILKEHTAAMAEQYGIPAQDIEAQYVQNTLLGLQSLSGAFTGEDKLPISEYRTTISKLKELNSKLFEDTGGELTPMEEGVSWYFDNVLDPYFKQTDGLYEKAQKLDAAGLSTTEVYQKIDKVKEQFQKVAHGGESYPGIDEFFWGTKNKTQQKLAMTGWMTKPVSWLSSWQREKVGYPSFQDEDEMFTRLQDLDARTQKFIEENNVSSGSSWMDSIQAWQQRQAEDIAHDYGKPGVDAYALESASPYERLRYFNYGENNGSMSDVYKMVDYTQSALKRNGLSPGGYSEYGVDLKLWVYDYIAQQEERDPEFLKLMTRLSHSTAPMQGASFHPTGVPLWEAIFFGNYNPSFIPTSLIDAAPQGAHVT